MEAGDLYDSLEIDEIPALRVMILAEDEKSEAAGHALEGGRHHVAGVVLRSLPETARYLKMREM